jgi:hypothetical protein
MFTVSNTETDMVETSLIYVPGMQIRTEAYLNVKLIQPYMWELSHTDSSTVWWLLILCNLHIIFKSFEHAVHTYFQIDWFSSIPYMSMEPELLI